MARNRVSTAISGLFWILVLFCSHHLLAQVNTERMRIAGEKQGFSATVDVNVRVQSGNIEVFDTGSGLRLQYTNGGHLVFLVANVQYAAKHADPFINKGFGHLRYNYTVNERISWEALTQLEYNEFTRLFIRRLIGSGLRMKLVSVTGTEIFLGTTYLLEYEHIDVAQGMPDSPITTVHRWSNYFIIRHEFSDNASMVNSIYVQPRFDYVDDLRILDELDLQANLTRRLALSLSLGFRYDGKPPSAVKKTDFEVRNSLRILF